MHMNLRNICFISLTMYLKLCNVQKLQQKTLVFQYTERNKVLPICFQKKKDFFKKKKSNLHGRCVLSYLGHHYYLNSDLRKGRTDCLWADCNVKTCK